jgi:hypothetical protein
MVQKLGRAALVERLIFREQQPIMQVLVVVENTILRLVLD